MRIFDSVAHSKDALIGGLQVLVHPNAARFPDFESAGLCQSCVWAYTDAENSQIAGQYGVVFENNGQLAVMILKAGKTVP